MHLIYIYIYIYIYIINANNNLTSIDYVKNTYWNIYIVVHALLLCLKSWGKKKAFHILHMRPDSWQMSVNLHIGVRRTMNVGRL